MDTTSDKNLFFFLLICSVKGLFYFRSHIVRDKDTSNGSGRTAGGAKLWSCIWDTSKQICRVPSFSPGSTASQIGYWSKPTFAVAQQLHQLCGFRWSSSLFTLPTSNTLLSTFIVKEYLQFWRWMAPSLSDPPEIHAAVYGNFQRSDVFHSNRNTFLVQSFCLTVLRWSFPH